MKTLKKVKTPDEFVEFIAKHEKGSAPSAGYFQDIIEKAQEVKNKTKFKTLF